MSNKKIEENKAEEMYDLYITVHNFLYENETTINSSEEFVDALFIDVVAPLIGYLEERRFNDPLSRGVHLEPLEIFRLIRKRAATAAYMAGRVIRKHGK